VNFKNYFLKFTNFEFSIYMRTTYAYVVRYYA